MITTFELKTGKRSLEIGILRSARKNIAFEISQEKGARLKVPKYMTDKAIRSFCQENAELLYCQYDKAMDTLPPYIPKGKAYEEIYVDGAYLPFGDGQIHLRIMEGGRPGTNIISYKELEHGEKELWVETLQKNAPESYRAGVEKWFREYARYTLTRKAIQFSEEMGVTFGRISIKEQKTRWGSCSSKGNINFNWKLVLMPEGIQDYIVVHELAHLKEMNHSARFWKEVEKVLPDYADRVKWQKRHEKEFSKY